MTPERIEIVWDQILSRNAELVRGMFQTLGADEQEAVFEHLALQIIRKAKMVEHPRKRKAGDKKASN